jgi:hypothetical protein
LSNRNPLPDLTADRLQLVGAIDLQFTEGQLREAGKRRVAGAEIVNRKIAFELSQSVGKFFWRPILQDHDGCRVNRQRLPLKLLFIDLPNS